nr:TraK family protein [uncultured Neisseria sp.]
MASLAEQDNPLSLPANKDCDVHVHHISCPNSGVQYAKDYTPNNSIYRTYFDDNPLKNALSQTKNNLLYRIIVFKTILLGSFGKALSKNWQSPIEMIQMGKIEKLVLTELAAMQKKGSSAGNKARFLAMQEDIKILLVDRNIPVISVWRILSEKKYVPYSYETFNRYCKMYIFKSDNTTDGQASALQSIPEKPASGHTDKELHPSASTNSEPIIAGGDSTSASGFVFNNDPNEKDLL